MPVADSGLPADIGLTSGLRGLAAFTTAPLDADEACHLRVHCALLEALAMLFESFAVPACGRLLGPLVPGATLAGGARVPGTPYELEPCQAAFNMGVLLHQPQESTQRMLCTGTSLAAILAVADYQSRQASLQARPGPRIADVLAAMMKAEILQAALLQTGGSRPPADPDLAQLAADAAVATLLFDGNNRQILHALAGIFPELAAWPAPGAGGHAGTRLSTANAACLAVRHALLALRGQPDVTAWEKATTPAPAFSHLGWRGPAAGAGAVATAASRLAAAAAPRLGEARAAALVAVCADHRGLRNMPVDAFVALTIH